MFCSTNVAQCSIFVQVVFVPHFTIVPSHFYISAHYTHPRATPICTTRFYPPRKIKEIEIEIEEITKKGKDIEINLNTAFKALGTASDDLKPDYYRLNTLLYAFSLIAIACGVGLFFIWQDAFDTLGNLETYDITRIWIFASPSLILVGFIAVSIVQVNRAQRQLQGLKRYSRKYKIIQIALEGYYGVEDKLSKTPIKAQETFEAIIKQVNEESINIDLEEDRIRQSNAKDQIPIKQLSDELIKYINQYYKLK